MRALAVRRDGRARTRTVTTPKRERAKAQAVADAAIAAIDRPKPAGVNAAGFGSDVAADALRALDIPYIALNPGASYRGFHDSIVNYLGNERPQMLLCLHEESAVAIAHGWAKVTGKAMAAAVHSNVGLMHATMAIFNAWCDRMPMVILGATGPVDAVNRRPWIDWIHTARDQGALIRGYTKWDDQPASPVAAREAILRAGWIANTAPCGPTYVNLDAGMQEERLPEPVAAIDTQRLMPEVQSAAPAAMVTKAAELLRAAKHPIILAGRVSRDLDAWNARIALAERLGARVVTDLKASAAFPTDHPLHAGAPGFIAPVPEAAEAIRNADVILSLDWIDVAGTFKHVGGTAAKVIQVSVDHHLHNGWSMDYQALPPVDVMIACEPDVDRRQRLIIHAPTVVQVVIDTHLNDLRRRAANMLEGSGDVDPVEAEDDIGIADRLGGLRDRRDEARRAGMQRMIGGEGGARLEVGDHAGAEPLSKRDARVPGVEVAGDAAGKDYRMLGGAQKLGGLGHHRRRCRALHLRHQPLRVDRGDRFGESFFLHAGVEIDVSRSARRRVG